jgi:hypothetical protein
MAAALKPFPLQATERFSLSPMNLEDKHTLSRLSKQSLIYSTFSILPQYPSSFKEAYIILDHDDLQSLCLYKRFSNVLRHCLADGFLVFLLIVRKMSCIDGSEDYVRQ